MCRYEGISDLQKLNDLQTGVADVQKQEELD